ncbi:PD-(D/E)XK nuclease family transposase [Merdimonas faecis]|uniref:PD-(D/E)XK nuclease family transposase n=1 Tax=Merdimonas faecis TaxID=1653435 RepID=UPI0023F758CD|nr:PD-(D/E)XK nuclease family transposase [Merdimonas faecis]
MANILQKYFPMIRTREEVWQEISEKEKLLEIYRQWNREQQEEFLDFCTGNKGIKILYDAFFKEILNPESAPERLEEFLSLILEQKVKILKVLPNDTVRIADESSLVIMDIVIEMEDHSIANVEVQKIGYLFAGQRSACYSADLLLRQYKRVKGEKGKTFSYRDIKKVYTIVLYEKSPREFKDFPKNYIHRFSQKSDTGVEMELLQEYVYIPLDVFRDIVHNKGIRNKLEAWLEFLSTDSPEEIAELVEAYPGFRKLYAEVYSLCLNVERVMEMFSKELQELDRNTVQYMIDEMQEEIDGKQEEINEQRRKLDEKEALILSLQEEIKQLKQEHEK